MQVEVRVELKRRSQIDDAQSTIPRLPGQQVAWNRAQLTVTHAGNPKKSKVGCHLTLPRPTSLPVRRRRLL